MMGPGGFLLDLSDHLRIDAHRGSKCTFRERTSLRMEQSHPVDKRKFENINAIAGDRPFMVI